MPTSFAPSRWLKLSAGVAVIITLGLPAAHLARTAAQDNATVQPVPVGQIDDASRLNAAAVHSVWMVPAATEAAEAQLVELLATARRERLPVSIAGARHSMGGHTIAPGGIVVDMRPFRAMSLNADQSVLTVQAGALWSEVIPFLDAHGRSVAIMQSDSSFSVGGSLSVNAHGWQAKRPPVSSSVKSFRLLKADGSIVRCSRQHNAELFSAVLGGYGLFGIILDAELWTVANEWYEVERHVASAGELARAFERQVAAEPASQMAFGRLRVTEVGFLDDALLTVYSRTDRSEPLPPLTESALDPLRRVIFRGSVGTDYGKRLRWNLESALGESIGERFVSRNQLLQSDVAVYANRSDRSTDILHEYFVPPEQLSAFLVLAREIIPRHEPDLLNVTLRDVRADEDTMLRYADRDLIAVVMFFNHARTAAADANMQAMTRELIEASLDVGGRYYLPYRLHATQEQFEAAYPQAQAFAALKRLHDPDGLFTNHFYLKYLSHRG